MLAAIFPFQGKTKPYRAICSGMGVGRIGASGPAKRPSLNIYGPRRGLTWPWGPRKGRNRGSSCLIYTFPIGSRCSITVPSKQDLLPLDLLFFLFVAAGEEEPLRKCLLMPEVEAQNVSKVAHASKLKTTKGQKEIAKVAKMCRKKTTRIRRPSSDRETETLLKLIVRNGDELAELERSKICGMCLNQGIQTSLRGKARNMEMDYLIEV